MNFTVDYTTKYAETFLKHLSQLRNVDCGGMEIGCFEGRTSRWFCENILTHPMAKLVCVDDWKDVEVLKRFQENTEGLYNLVPIHASSNDIEGKPNLLAFCYIDGDHRCHQVLLDMCRAWGWLAKGGILLVDDYLLPHTPTKPKEAIDAFLSCMEGQYELLHKDNLVILKKL